MPGRRPKPLALQRIEGDTRKVGARKHQVAMDAADAALPFARGVGDAPRHMSTLAKRCWLALVPELDRIGMLREVNAAALEGVCEAYADAVLAGQEVKKNGVTVTTYEKVDGKKVIVAVRKNPAVEIKRAAWAQYRLFCVEFGLTPVSEGKVRLGRTGPIITTMEDKLCA